LRHFAIFLFLFQTELLPYGKKYMTAIIDITENPGYELNCSYKKKPDFHS